MNGSRRGNDRKTFQLETKLSAALLLVDSLLEVHGLVVMDTAEDRDLHDRTMATFRGLRVSIDSTP